MSTRFFVFLDFVVAKNHTARVKLEIFEQFLIEIFLSYWRLKRRNAQVAILKTALVLGIILTVYALYIF